MAKSPLVQMLSTEGNGGGTTSIAADFSSGEAFYIDRIRDTVGTGFQVAHLAIVRLMFMVRDAGAFGAGEFGNISGGLTNGVSIVVTEASGEQVNLTPIPISNNAGFGGYAYDVNIPSGTNDEVLLSRWTLSKFLGFPGLILKPGDKLSAEVSDDFSGLIDFSICAQGYAESSV